MGYSPWGHKELDMTNTSLYFWPRGHQDRAPRNSSSEETLGQEPEKDDKETVVPWRPCCLESPGTAWPWSDTVPGGPRVLSKHRLNK